MGKISLQIRIAGGRRSLIERKRPMRPWRCSGRSAADLYFNFGDKWVRPFLCAFHSKAKTLVKINYRSLWQDANTHRHVFLGRALKAWVLRVACWTSWDWPAFGFLLLNSKNVIMILNPLSLPLEHPPAPNPVEAATLVGLMTQLPWFVLIYWII